MAGSGRDRFNHRISRQRGAAAVFVAVTIIAGLTALFLALDVGRLYFAQRNLQRTANMAALNAARTNVCDLNSQDLLQTVRNTISANDPNDAGLINVRNNTVPVGRVMTDSNHLRYFANENSTNYNDPIGVQVNLSRPAPFNFLSVLYGGKSNPQLYASATASDDPKAGLTAGGQVLSVNSANSPLLNSLLDGLLGINTNLSVLDSQSLVNATVSMQGLAASLGVGNNLNNLLQTSVTGPQLANAVLNALGSQANSTLQDALQQIGSNTSSVSAKLGDFISVNSVATLNGNLKLGVFQLLRDLGETAAAENGGLINIPNLNINILGVSTTIGLNVMQPPQIAFGRPGVDPATGNWLTEAKSAEIAANVDLNIDSTQIPLLGSILSLLVDAQLNLNVFLAAGQADAHLTSIQCARDGQPYQVVNVGADSALLRLGIGKVTDPLGSGYSVAPTEVTQLKLLGLLSLVNLYAKASTTAGNPESQSLVYDLNNDSQAVNGTTNPQTVQTSLGTTLSGAVSNLQVQLYGTALGLPVNVSSVTSVLQPVLSSIVSSLGTALLDPLAQLLGIEAGNASVLVSPLVVNQPTLVDLRRPS